MSKLVVYMSFIPCLLLANLPSHAVGVGGRVSTIGLGLEVAQPLARKLNFRAGLSAFSYNLEQEQDQIDYELDANFAARHFLLDWHPFAGTFRLSGGLFNNKTEFSFVSKQANTSQPYSVGNDTWTSDNARLTGTMRFQPIAPYLGLGWGWRPNRADGGLSFTADIGVIYQGAPNIDLDASGTATSQKYNITVDIATYVPAQEELVVEEANLEKEGKSYTYYPFIALGLQYSF